MSAELIGLMIEPDDEGRRLCECVVYSHPGDYNGPPEECVIEECKYCRGECDPCGEPS